MCAENCEWLLGIAGWVALLLIFLALLLASVGTTLLAIWRRSRLDRLRQRQLAAFRRTGRVQGVGTDTHANKATDGGQSRSGGRIDHPRVPPPED